VVPDVSSQLARRRGGACRRQLQALQNQSRAPGTALHRCTETDSCGQCSNGERRAASGAAASAQCAVLERRRELGRANRGESRRAKTSARSVAVKLLLGTAAQRSAVRLWQPRLAESSSAPLAARARLRYHLSTTAIRLGRIDAGDVGWRGWGVDGHDSGGGGRGRSIETCDKCTWAAGGFTAAGLAHGRLAGAAARAKTSGSA
jgi:hypothetical protein